MPASASSSPSANRQFIYRHILCAINREELPAREALLLCSDTEFKQTMNHYQSSVIRVAWGESLTAMRANLIPGLFLQLLMASMAGAYYLNHESRIAFEHLAQLRSQWGLVFSFVGTSVASAVFPELLRFAISGRNGTTSMPIGHRLLFAILFWGLIGMQVDLFYRLQYAFFGPSDTNLVIIKKVIVDAFIYCPLLAIPQAVCAFLWRDHGFTMRGFRGHHPVTFYALRIFPVLIANWMVWIPLVTIIYSLPAALGVPFFIVAQSFWVMVFTTLSERKK